MYDKLTIVLVTQPSRINYLTQSFMSIDQAMVMHPRLHLLVVFNGQSKRGVAALKGLMTNHAGRVSMEVIEENQSVPNDLIRIMKSHNLKWVHMPGDDDILIPKGYEIFFSVSRENSSKVALAHTALCQDDNGVLTGKILKPFVRNTHSRNQKIARSLHRPPFVWPSLIFDFSKFPATFYHSRFVFDWWVGLLLIQIGDVEILDEPLVRYRTHSAQESMQVQERRKRFEAELMIQSNLICNIDSLIDEKDEDFASFLREIEKFPPIFGDTEFGASISLLLRDYCGSLHGSLLHLSESYLSQYCAKKGVSILMSEFPSLYPDFIERFHGLSVSFDIGDDVCSEARGILRKFENSSSKPLLTILCLHSNLNKSVDHDYVTLDCSMAGKVTAKQLVGQVVSDIEISGIKLKRSFDLSGWELNVIKFLRFVLSRTRKVRSILRP